MGRSFRGAVSHVGLIPFRFRAILTTNRSAGPRLAGRYQGRGHAGEPLKCEFVLSTDTFRLAGAALLSVKLLTVLIKVGVRMPNTRAPIFNGNPTSFSNRAEPQMMFLLKG